MIYDAELLAAYLMLEPSIIVWSTVDLLSMWIAQFAIGAIIYGII